MSLEIRKLSFIQEFLRLQNEEIVKGLETFLRNKKIELIENDFKAMDLDHFNDEINSALNDSKNNRIIKASELKNKVQKWD